RCDFCQRRCVNSVPESKKPLLTLQKYERFRRLQVAYSNLAVDGTHAASGGTHDGNITGGTIACDDFKRRDVNAKTTGCSETDSAGVHRNLHALGVAVHTHIGFFGDFNLTSGSQKYFCISLLSRANVIAREQGSF